MPATVQHIFVAARGAETMRSVAEVEALEGRGLRGDRYCERSGYWTGIDECQVTLIEAEELERIADETGLRIQNGEHRRNLVTRGVRLASLAGKRFRVGEVVLEFDRPRPPCAYIQSLTEPGMTRALSRHGGICARVVSSGTIRADDAIDVLED